MRIDAKGKTLGRLASQIAKILQGKHKPDYDPSKEGEEVVEVINVKEMKISGKKFKNKLYFFHSGYLGHEKKIPLEKIWEKDPGRVLKMAVYGMLPKNKLRKKRIKRLKILS